MAENDFLRIGQPVKLKDNTLGVKDKNVYLTYNNYKSKKNKNEHRSN